MTEAFKRALVRAWGKRALQDPIDMLAQGHAKGYGDDLTPVGKPKANPDFDPAAYDAENKGTWPCDPGSGKGAFLPSWQNRRTTALEIARYGNRGDSLGIVCRADPAGGSCIAWIDCDITEDGPSSYAMTALKMELAKQGITQFPVRRRGSYSWLVAVRITDGVPTYEQRHTKRGGYSLERGGAGHQFVALGQHACGAWRYWTRHRQTTEAPLAEMPARDELPKLTLTQFYELFDAVAAVCGAAKGAGKRESGGVPTTQMLPKDDFEHHAVPHDRKAVFLAVLAAMPNTKEDRDKWIGCLCVLIGTGRKMEKAELCGAVHDWNAKFEGSEPAEDERVVDDLWRQRGRLSQGWPEFVQWAKAELGSARLLALDVTHAEMFPCDPTSGKPVVRLSRAGLAENVAEIAAALSAKGVPVLSFGGKVVHPRPGVGASLAALDRHGMRLLLSQELAFEQYNAKAQDWLACAIPQEIADLMLSAPAQALLPQVKGLLEWPSLRPDGSLIDQPGHDAAAGFYLTRTVEGLTVPAQPTRREAESALALVQGLLSEFPFVNPESESAAIATILHIAGRPLMDVVPMLVVTSPSPRTGKSYLLQTVCAAALGRQLASVGATQDAKENDKRLAGMLLAGQPIIHLDNIERRLASPLLAQAIENPEISIRVLGTSTMMPVSNSYSIVANGNNIGVSGDLPARCLYCELDARAESPEHRQFKRRPLTEVLADQGAYLSAALTILRWGMRAKLPTPAGIPPLASFGRWSKLVREPLIHLSLPDPCLTQERLRAESDDWAEQDAAAFAALADLTNGKPHTMQELLAATLGLAPDLMGALLDVMEDDHRRGTVDRHKLSYWLRKHKGRTLGGVTLTVHQPSYKGLPRQWTFARPRKARSGAPAPLLPPAEAPDDMV